MDTIPVRLPADAKPGAVVELYRLPDGTMAAEVRIPSAIVGPYRIADGTVVGGGCIPAPAPEGPC